MGLTKKLPFMHSRIITWVAFLNVVMFDSQWDFLRNSPTTAEYSINHSSNALASLQLLLSVLSILDQIL